MLFPTLGFLPEQWKSPGRGALGQNIPAVAVSDGDDGAADQEGVGIAGGTVSDAGDVCAGGKPQIQETAPEGTGAENFFYAGGLARLQLV